MKVLVTGVAGFLGSHIADTYLSKGYEVVGIDSLIGGEIDNVPKGVEFFQADLANLESISPIFRDVQVVVHSACTAYEGLSVFSPNLVVQNTTQITASVLSASVQNSVKKFIYMSSMARYGYQEQLPFVEEMVPNPQDPYGIAKLSAELLTRNICETHGIDWVILVPHNIIGPRQKYDDPYRNVASIMINRMLKNQQPIIYGSGNQKRCFSFVKDMLEPIFLATKITEANRQVINIGPDEEFITINYLAELIARILNFDLDPIYMPERPKEVFLANCSADKARKLIGFQTKTPLEEGVKELINWIAEKGPREFKYHLPLEIINPLTPKTWTSQLI
jgi:UDP-glucose 4-epimerase